MHGQDGGFGVARGLKLGLLLAIPLWLAMGGLALPLFGASPIAETLSVVCMIAAVSEAILVRSIWRADRVTASRLTVNAVASIFREIGHAGGTTLSRAMALGALAGSYLYYYFCEIQLQIASLNSLVVFIPVPSLARAAT
jgi:hypothetical protein